MAATADSTTSGATTPVPVAAGRRTTKPRRQDRRHHKKGWPFSQPQAVGLKAALQTLWVMCMEAGFPRPASPSALKSPEAWLDNAPHRSSVMRDAHVFQALVALWSPMTSRTAQRSSQAGLKPQNALARIQPIMPLCALTEAAPLARFWTMRTSYQIPLSPEFVRSTV